MENVNISFDRNILDWAFGAPGEVTISSTEEKIVCLAHKIDIETDLPADKSNYVRIDTHDGNHLYVKINDVVNQILKSNNPDKALALIDQVVTEGKESLHNNFWKAVMPYVSDFPSILDNAKSKEDVLNEIKTLVDLSKSNVVNAPPEFFSQYARACDIASNMLLSKESEILASFPNDVLMENVAAIRKASSNIFIGQDQLGIKFSQNDVPNLVLIGKKMDPGIHYQNIGNSHIRDNQIQITQRNIKNINTGTYVPRTELRFVLNPEARRDLKPFVDSVKNEGFRATLKEQFGGDITVTDNYKTHFEVSDSPGDATGVLNFHESDTVYGDMLRIELAGVGEILIGNEDMSVSEEAQAMKDTTGRFFPHHTVVVRLYNAGTNVDNDQLERMHKLLSLAGLSGTLVPTPDSTIEKKQILSIAQMYLPHLSYPIEYSKLYVNKTPTELKNDIIELLHETAKEKGEITRNEMRDIFDKELQGIKKETCVLGSQTIKFSGVSDKMQKEGTLGFFCGISGGAAVVASVLKTGLLASGPRGLAGFAWPPSCHQDAVSGCQRHVFLRQATESTVDNPDFKLEDCPWISMFQAVVSLDAANLPHHQMEHNTFGMTNPQAEITKKEDQEAASGTSVLASQNPMQFAAKQNIQPTHDNEMMIRSDSLDARYITKIAYQDPRKALYNYLEKNSFPPELLTKMGDFINKGGNIPDDLQTEIKTFLKNNNLVTISIKLGKENWDLKDFAARKFFGSELTRLFIDNKATLKAEMTKNGTLDKDGNLTKGDVKIPFDEFVVEANQLSRKLFK